MKEKLYCTFIELTNGRWTSSILYRFARSRLSHYFIPSFAKHYRIQLDELEKPIKEYASIHEFFTRRLKSDIRLVDKTPDVVVSPVDAMIEDFGKIDNKKPIVVKGKSYEIAEMLGNEDLAAKYRGGDYIVFYLSPSNYHRIHAPLDAQIVATKTLGKKSFPVNRLGMTYGKNPLSKNYRQVTEMLCNGAHVVMVKVGAMFVNSIERVHSGEELRKGEEMAYFSFGSTVVLLFEKDSFKMDKQIVAPYAIQMGERVGRILV